MHNQRIYNKPYLVITRPEPGLSETAQKVMALGWTPILMPVMHILTLPVGNLNMRSVQAIVFTSRQAIMPTLKQLLVQNISYQNIPVFTVGNITAEDAKQAGFLNVISADKDAVALANLLKEKLQPHSGKLLLPSAKEQGQLLIALLKQAGFIIVHHEVYKTEPINKLSDEFLTALQAEKINSILFFSSETARFFIELIPNELKSYLKMIQAVGISIKTKNQLERLKWRSIDVAARPNTEEMLCLLKEHS